MSRDKLFLLSISEIKKYLPTEESRRCKCDVWFRDWWLRSPGASPYYAASVNRNGYLSRYGSRFSSNIDAVRPALHLNPAHLQTLERTKKGYVRFGGKKWIVLDEEAGLLLSKKAICLHHFDRKSNSYEESEIQEYLNNELLNELFTKEEQKMVVDTIIDGEKSHPAAA